MNLNLKMEERDYHKIMREIERRYFMSGRIPSKEEVKKIIRENETYHYLGCIKRFFEGLLK